MTDQRSRLSATLAAENVGGIDQTEVTFEPGVTILRGRNASNRTSLLQAIMAAMGSDRVSLKADADQGRVELSMDGESYHRTLERTSGRLSLAGDPYLEDATVADRFAFLLESNEARRAILREGDLRDVIMEPVDVEEIRADIRAAEERKRELDSRIEELETAASERADLEARKGELESEIEETEAELAAAEAAIEEADVALEAGLAQSEALEEKLDAVRDRQGDLEAVRERLRSERQSKSALESELADLEDELAEAEEETNEELPAIEREIRTVRERKRGLESTISQLQNIVQFNRSILSDDAEVPPTFRTDQDRPVTDQLIEDTGEVECWTCGSTVAVDAVQETTDRITAILDEHRQERAALEDRLAELTDRRDELESRQARMDRARERRSELEAEHEERVERIEALEADRASLTEEIEALEAEVEAMEREEYSELLARHRETNELAFELERLRDEHESVTEKIERVDEQLATREKLETEREELVDELADLRTRIERIETGAIEAFNEQMDHVLDLLGYENIERIWLERTAQSTRNDSTETATFDLHVVRQENGVTFEDALANLSESEREVTGLVFALAGYLVHDVHETVPFMLLDSMEAIDADRIAALVDHFEEQADYVVVALLPEDAAALDDGYDRITEI